MTIPYRARKVFSGVLFDVYQWRHENLDGSACTYEAVSRPATAYVLPVHEGRLLVGRRTSACGPVVTFVIGGRIEPEEDAATAALRELQEEAGVEAESALHWFSFSPHEKISWDCHVFLAFGVSINRDERRLYEAEELEAMTLDELFARAIREDFAHMDLGWQFLALAANCDRRAEAQALIALT
jgi:8-oxo-dGTP pyrophosphatase MutT (NUDIX family)